MRERVRALRLCRRAMQTSEQKFRGPEAERRIHNEASSINLGDNCQWDSRRASTVSSLHVLHRLGDVKEQLRVPALGRYVVLEARAEGRVAQRVGQALPQRLARTSIIGQAQEAANDVLEQSS